MADPKTVYQIERNQDVMVVAPQGPAMNYRYNEIHMESNLLMQIFDEPELKHVLFDLNQGDYLDSVIIGALIRLAQQCRMDGGRATFCNGSEHMLSVLKCIKVGDLWPYFETRAEALAELQD